MTQKDKELLLKDLCARLPYGVKVAISHFDEDGNLKRISEPKIVDGYYDEKFTGPKCYGFGIYEVKPYLRPLLSMTEEEIKELKTLCSIYIPTDSPIIGFEDYGIVVFTHHLINNTYSFKLNIDIIDWLSKKMFDYRTDEEGETMIEKELALEAPEGMYK